MISGRRKHDQNCFNHRGNIFLLSLSGCKFDAAMDGLIVDNLTKQEIELLASLEATIAQRDQEAFIALFVKDVQQQDNIEAAIENVFSFIPDGAFIERSFVGFKTFKGTNGAAKTVSEHYVFENGVTVITTQWSPQTTPLRINTVNIAPIAPEIEVQQQLSFEDHKTKKIGFMMAGAFVFIFIVATLFTCLFTPFKLSRKILWSIAIISALWPLALNWATGDIAFQLLNASEHGLTLNILEIQFFGVSFTRTTTGPWILEVALPIGATFFWLHRNERKRRITNAKNDAPTRS